MAVLARLLGIPSRVAVGYTPGTPRRHGRWLVKTSDAHAWPELYFQGAGWLRFEPTPAGSAGQATAFPPTYTLPQQAASAGLSDSPPGARRRRAEPEGSPDRPARCSPTAGPGWGIRRGAQTRRQFDTGRPAGRRGARAGSHHTAVGQVTHPAPALARRRRRSRRAQAAWLELLDDLADYRDRHAGQRVPARPGRPRRRDDAAVSCGE